jgi:imidazolonepropionase-like amidohydrolase
VLAFEDGIAYPGLVDAGSYQGIRRDRDDPIGAFQPGLRVADGFDALDPGFARNLEAGITTVHLVPGDAAVVGGRTAVVKVGPGGAFRVLDQDAGLKLSFVEAAYPQTRAPTSLMGAVDALREPARDLADALAALRKSGKPAFLSASTNREVQVALRARPDLGGKVVLMGDLNAGRFAADVAQAAAGVILGPLPYQRARYEWAYLADLARVDVPIAFATWSPPRPPSSLRLSVVVATLRGLPVQRALRAVTLDAARLVGVDAKVGSLEAGKDADLIVLSAPIEDPRARLLLCVQDGKVVFREVREAGHE